MRGEAVIEAEPELATLVITVEAQGPDRQATMDALLQRARAVTELVERFAEGVERSETSRLHVYPELERKKTEKVRRYVGSTTITLMVHDFAVLSDLVISASAIELATVDGPWWRLRPDSPVYRSARIAAAADALTRARDYAQAYGAQVVGLVEIADEGMAHQQQPPVSPLSFGVRAMESSGREMADGSFDLAPASQQVTGHVEARFELTRPDLASAVPEADGSSP